MKKTIIITLLLFIPICVFAQETNVIIFNTSPQNAFFISIDNANDKLLIAPHSRIELLLEPGIHNISIVDTFNTLINSQRFSSLFIIQFKFKPLEITIEPDTQYCIEIKAKPGNQEVQPAVSYRSHEDIKKAYQLSDQHYVESKTPKETYWFFSINYFFEQFFMRFEFPEMDITAWNALCPFSLEAGRRFTLSATNGIMAELRLTSITFLQDARTLAGFFGSFTFLKIPLYLWPFRTYGCGFVTDVYEGIGSDTVKISPNVMFALFMSNEIPLYISRDFILSYTLKFMFVYDMEILQNLYNYSFTYSPLTIYSGFQFEY